MIAYCYPLPIGNAVGVLLAPPAGATAMRVLRKLTDDISGPADTGASIAYEGDENYFVDTTSLPNGTPQFYQAFARVSGVWVVSGSSDTATPASTAELLTPDPLELVRKRLAAGLKVEVLAGRIRHDKGAVPVFSAPPKYEGTVFPVVSMHLRGDSPAHRGLGDMVAADLLDEESDDWTASEGWVSSVGLDIIGWVIDNGDLRIALRQAIKKVLLANMPVFRAAGMDQIEFSFTDVEDMESYAAPMYQVHVNFTCTAPSVVAALAAPISDVTVQAA